MKGLWTFRPRSILINSDFEGEEAGLFSREEDLRSELLLAAALGVLLPCNAEAQDTRDAELAGSDRQLNGTYLTIIRQLLPADQAALRRSERLWITFRDADCDFGWGDRRDCLIQRTDEREQQLRDSTYFDARDHVVALPKPR